jgi:hypothetical protein
MLGQREKLKQTREERRQEKGGKGKRKNKTKRD